MPILLQLTCSPIQSVKLAMFLQKNCIFCRKALGPCIGIKYCLINSMAYRNASAINNPPCTKTVISTYFYWLRETMQEKHQFRETRYEGT